MPNPHPCQACGSDNVEHTCVGVLGGTAQDIYDANRHTCQDCGHVTPRKEPMPNPQQRTYLGDGLYAEHDGLGFTLAAQRDGGEHWVYLEPQVMESLLRFVEQKWKVKITVKEIK